MEIFLEQIQMFSPWVFLISITLIFIKLLSWAKNRKTGILIIGLLMQMFLPDPYVEVKVVQQDKQKEKEKAKK